MRRRRFGNLVPVILADLEKKWKTEEIIGGLDKVQSKLVDLITDRKISQTEYNELSGYIQSAIRKLE